MKNFFLMSAVLLGYSLPCLGQKFEISLGKEAGTSWTISDGENDTKEIKAEHEVKSFFVKVDKGTDYRVDRAGVKIGEIKDNKEKYEIKSDEDLRDRVVQIVKDGVPLVNFKFVKDNMDVTGLGASRNGSGPPNGAKLLPSLNSFIASKFPRLAPTEFGIQLDNNSSTAYRGKKYVHIFFDQFGNNIFSTIPQGISNLQYVVHIFYIQDKNHENLVAYSVNQLDGEFSDAIVFNNSSNLTGLEIRSKNDDPEAVSDLAWAHAEYLLSTSTSNIKFEINRSRSDADEIVKQTLGTYTIKMSKVYHGSFDVGLLNSNLRNPTFELLVDPADVNKRVVKRTDGKNRGVVSLMASFYVSPIIIIEKLSGKDIPTYKLSGRNFLDDHKIYERIYPTIGVSINERSFNNLFYGFNWEFARGGAFFFGGHYGKVNVFDRDQFEFQKTNITESEFNLARNTAWKSAWAFGAKLDIMIFRNLFGMNNPK